MERVEMSGEFSKRCANCLLPETPRLQFDQDGGCKLCSSPALLSHIAVKPDPGRLEEVLARTRNKGKGREYDCVVGLSGGRDSTFLLYRLVKTHQLRCVAIFGKTLFTPVEIVQNVREITRTLNVKLVEITIPFEHHRKVAAFSIGQWMKTHEPIFINLACAPCKFVNREILRWAAKHDVNTVIYGGNRFEYFPFGPAAIDLSVANRYSLATMFVDNLARIRKGIRLLLQSPAILRHAITFYQASLLYVNQYTVYLRLRYPSILRFDYFHYADWNEDEIHQVLKKLNWKLPPNCNSTWRADCVFEAIKNTAFQQQLGYSYTEALFSNLIRAGKLNRSTGLERLAHECVSEQRLKCALELIGIPYEDFKTGREKPYWSG
jgi:hypothetical protein